MEIRKINFNLTIMGIHQWRLKFYFIYLTLELLMPCYFTMSSENIYLKGINVVGFNITLVKILIRPKLDGVPDARPEQKMMRSE